VLVAEIADVCNFICQEISSLPILCASLHSVCVVQRLDKSKSSWCLTSLAEPSNTKVHATILFGSNLLVVVTHTF
jgi:hypothetical protein